MGRSWAVSKIVQNYAQIVPNPYIITSAEVVPRNKAGLLRTWPLLIVILRISRTHFLQRVRVKIETFSQVAEFFPYKIRKKSMQKGKAAGDLVDLVNL